MFYSNLAEKKDMPVFLTVDKWSAKYSVLQNFAKITGKHLRQGISINKVAGWEPATLLNRDSNVDVFLWILRNY